jgi:RNA polymerase primary sigma factor
MERTGTSIKDRSLNHAMRLYLKEISRIPLLTPEEEKILAVRAQEGDKDAFQKLVESNLRFVIKVAKRYTLSGLPLLDLINQGNVGLIEAARRFDPTRKVRFTSYAIWWIRQSILLYLSQAVHIFRVTPRAANILYRIKRFVRKNDLTKELPSREVLAKELGISIGEVNGALDAEGGVVSLDQPIEESGELRLGDALEQHTIPSPDTVVTSALLTEHLDRSLNGLTAIEQTIVRSRFGLDDDNPLTLAEIGKKLRLSRERIRQIEAKALIKLRQSLSNSSLAEYVN